MSDFDADISRLLSLGAVIQPGPGMRSDRVLLRPNCRAPGCTRTDLQGYGYCGMHYMRLYRYGDVADRWPDVCRVAFCGRRGRLARGLCHKHYVRLWRNELRAL